MNDLTEIVDGLENKIGKLLQKFDLMERDRESLLKELKTLQAENKELQLGIEDSQSKIKTLKAANALLGSNEYKKETKLKINGLIREIDQCIVQLSE